MGDSSTVDFEFDIPENAKEKTYVFELKTYYDYDTRRDTYRITSAKKFINLDPFKVEGNCEAEVSTNSNVQITADLDPETPDAIAGKQVIVTATLRNTGDVKATYTISVSGNSAWSNLNSIEPQVITLEKGESKDSNIILNIDDNAEGDKEFIIKASYGDKSTEQRVALTVTKEELQSDAILTHLKDNWFIYAIVLVNVILLVAIVLVVRRMLSRKEEN
jgi:uncharacterized membrane protein